jgi:predicted O-methyltransferase YrrM
MIRRVANGLLHFVPRATLDRIGYKFLRFKSGEFRAYTDLFVSPYKQRIAWSSGLGESVNLLYGLVRALEPRVVVEIGSARGKSTCTIALACRQNNQGKVYAIDPHTPTSWSDRGVENDTETFLRARLQEYELEPWCDIIKSTSAEAGRKWDKPIDLLFIDGDHTYHGVKSDFEAFRKWLTPSALVLFHDTLWEHHPTHPGYRSDNGVPKYLNELQREGYQSVTISAHPGMTIVYPRKGQFPFLVPAKPNGDIGWLAES